jgi:hypothetical protein
MSKRNKSAVNSLNQFVNVMSEMIVLYKANQDQELSNETIEATNEEQSTQDCSFFISIRWVLCYNRSNKISL